MWWISSHQYRLAVVKYIAIPHDTTCFPCAFMTINPNNSSVLIIRLISLGRSKLATNGKNVHHQSPPSRIEFQHGSIRLFHRPCASQGGRQVDEAANPGGREVAVGNFLSGYPSGGRFKLFLVSGSRVLTRLFLRVKRRANPKPFSVGIPLEEGLNFFGSRVRAP
jgi:hypothetical protein